ncbi:response regulator [Cohnella sp. CFH 77786]|nr:response regulator transcription factor [Cohnella sp. CFH 77786]MBW5448083.1 response regulator [Cohnella sp. CFH 77786]
MARILVIEDDQIIGEMLTLYLTEEQFTVQRVETARDGFQALFSFRPDVILLDLVLPDSQGTEMCAEFRRHTDIPLIVISMKTGVTDRIQAISAGADDYLVKPFSMQELKARIGAVLRRAQISSTLAAWRDEAAATAESVVRTGITLDLERRALLKDGRAIETTFSEFEIMKHFVERPGKVYTREELINAVRGIDSFVNDRAIDVHVTNLRRKLEDNPKQPQHIKTVWGVGYKFIR